MCTIVDGQANCNNIIDNSYTIECNVPKEQETQEEKVNKSNTEQDEHGHSEVCRNNQNDNEDSCQC